MNYQDDLQSLFLSDEFTTEFTPPRIISLVKYVIALNFAYYKRLTKIPSLMKKFQIILSVHQQSATLSPYPKVHE